MRKRKHKIRLISIVFVGIAIGITGVIFMPFFQATVFSKKTLKKTETNSFKDVSISLYDSKDRQVNISAEKVSENSETSESYNLKRMTSDFMIGKDKCSISSDHANTISNEKIDFSGNVQVKTVSGLNLYTDHSLVDTKKKTGKGNCAIAIEKDSLKLLGNAYYIDFDNKQIHLKGNAKGQENDKVITSNILNITLNNENKIDEMQAKGKAKYTSNKFNLTAENIQYKKSILEANTNIEYYNTERKEHIYANKLQSKFDKTNHLEQAEFIGNVKYISDKKVLTSSKLSYKNDQIQAEENVVFTYTKANNHYEIKSSILNAKLNNGKISTIYSNKHLIIKSNNDIIRADSGKLINNRLFLHGNVYASGTVGDIFGEDAELNLDTSEITIKKSGGIVIESKQNAK